VWYCFLLSAIFKGYCYYTVCSIQTSHILIIHCEQIVINYGLYLTLEESKTQRILFRDFEVDLLLSMQRHGRMKQNGDSTAACIQIGYCSCYQRCTCRGLLVCQIKFFSCSCISYSFIFLPFILSVLRSDKMWEI
jgi:hypothetical protein